MAGTTFQYLSKPPTSGDEKEMFRWQYRIVELLNGILANHTLTDAEYASIAGLNGLGPYLPSVGGAVGNGTDQSYFETDGTLRFDGAATVWNDAFVDALSLQGGATDPPVFAAFQNGVYGRRFDNATVMSAHGTIELPHDYKEGTAVDLHIHWSPTTTNTGNCQWSVEWTIANINGVYGATTTSSAVQAGAGVVNTHQLLDVVTISGTGRKISDVIYFRVFRDGNAGADTFTGNAFLHRIAVHYECDTVGSRQEMTK